MNKNEKNIKKQGLIIFVEGETDKVFYDKLIKHLLNKYNTKTSKEIVIENLKGIPRYIEAHRIFEKKIKPKYKDIDFNSICSYDTDVFEFSANPPIKWDEVEKNLSLVGIREITHIRAKVSIEDWFLIDINGLCKYLKINKVPKTLKGKTGLDKIKVLFKMKNKIYQKGHYVHAFMDFLDFELICKQLGNESKRIIEQMFYNEH